MFAFGQPRNRRQLQARHSGAVAVGSTGSEALESRQMLSGNTVADPGAVINSAIEQHASQQAKDAVSNAENQVQQAQEAVDQAADNLDRAKGDLTAAETARDQAQADADAKTAEKQRAADEAQAEADRKQGHR